MLPINACLFTWQLIFSVLILLFVINIGIETEAKALSPNALKEVKNVFEDNQWVLEDQLCDQLEAQNIQICTCQVGYDNLLSLVCNATDIPEKSFESLEVTFILINQLTNITELQIDTFELIGFPDFKENENNMTKLVFPNVKLNTLKILDSSKQLIQRHQLPEKLQLSLKTLYITNVNIDSEVFSFMSQFNKLHTAQFSNLSFEPVLDSKITFADESCFTSLRKLSLNHDCVPLVQPVISIKSKIFKNLCNLSLLDLSCLGLKDIPSGLLHFNLSSKRSKYLSKLTVDLSRNQLSSFSDFIADLTQNNCSQLELNLNYNPFKEIPEKDINHFNQLSNSELQIWQDSMTTKLNCSSCANAWLAKHKYIKTFCVFEKSHKSILIEQLTNADFQHCHDNN